MRRSALPAMCLTAALVGASLTSAHADVEPDPLGPPEPPATELLAAGVATQRAALRQQDCGDKRLKKPGGGYWRCSFADSFDGKRLNRRKWTVVETAAHGYHSGDDACFVDRPGNVFVKRGALRLRTRSTSTFLCEVPGMAGFVTNYTSGSVSTSGKFDQTYGRYQFRVKFPESTREGLHSAVWLYPSKHRYGAWPASGEIDIAELFTAYPDRLIPYIHYLKSGVPFHDTNEYCHVRDLGKYHDIVLVWTARRMQVKYDGNLCLRVSPNADLPGHAPFDRPFNVVLTQALGVGWNPFRADFTQLPATMTIDYVRVWR